LSWQVIVGTSALQEGSTGGVWVYPNPTDGKVILEGEVRAGDYWELLDIVGRKVAQIELSEAMTQEVDLPIGLRSGSYIWQLRRENQVVGRGLLSVLR
jgi:hypothetical protein